MTRISVVLFTFSLCGLIIVASLVVIGSLFYEAQTLLSDSLLEINEFKFIVDDAWNKMAYANGRTIFRIRRSDDMCRCSLESENHCQAGEPGPKGQPGIMGQPGEPGMAGRKGAPGLGLQDRPGGCIACPAGQHGPIGEPGPEGPPGPDGQDGPPGGIQGPPGPSGDQGAKGPQGPKGPKGTRGLDGGQCPKPNPGRPGIRGPAGPRGSEGPEGPTGADGKPGIPGYDGLPGRSGMDGEGGAPGSYGDNGLPGDDATYCRCPHRSPMALEEVNPAFQMTEEKRKKRLEFYHIPRAHIIY